MCSNSNEIYWKERGDLLGRHTDAEFLKSFLLAQSEKRKYDDQSRAFVLNINAPWGLGKSFFLEGFSEQLSDDGYLVATINAWKNDYGDDALLPVINAILEALKPNISKKQEVAQAVEDALSKAKRATGAFLAHASRHLIKKYTGDALDAALTGYADSGTAEDDENNIDYGECFDIFTQNFETQKKSEEELKSSLSHVLSEGLNQECKKPMFVFLDELDRCRPTYAIETLERIKHLFDIKDLFFVLATDTKQLCHSIGVVYGEKFNSDRYLHRFFDRTYNLENPSTRDFVKFLLKQKRINLDQFHCQLTKEAASIVYNNKSIDEFDCYVEFISEISIRFELQLRDIEQCIDTLESFSAGWNAAQYTAKIDLLVVFTLICLHHQKRQKISLDEAARVLRDEIPDITASTILRSRQGYRQVSSIRFAQYFEKCWQHARDIKDHVSDGNPSSWDQVIMNQFAQEMITRNKKEPVTPSLVMEYADIISQAGRMRSRD